MDEEQISMLYMHFLFNDNEASIAFENQMQIGMSPEYSIEAAMVLSYNTIQNRLDVN